jgi:hypothetical protein
MNANRFEEIVRDGADKLRVDDIVLTVGQRAIHGKGMMRIEREIIGLDMTLDPGEEPPHSRSGVHTKRDFWRVSGVIEDHLLFRCDYVSPGWPSSYHTPEKTTVTCSLDLKPIELIPSWLDRMSTQERAHWQKHALEHEGQAVEAEEQSSKQPSAVPAAEPIVVAFRAVLMEFPLLPFLWTTKNTEAERVPTGQAAPKTLSCDGEIDGFEFSLLKHENGQDLCVHLDSKKDYESPGVEADWRKFDAFMNALAFAVGVHAWPYRVEYWRDGRKLTDRFTPACRLARTPHAPFTKELAFNARVGRLDWSFQQALRKAAAFFEIDSALSNEVTQILFLFREAGDRSVHHGVGMIALCALLENLVRVIFKERKPDERQTLADPGLVAFQKAKEQVLGFIENRMTENEAGFRRLKGIIESKGTRDIEEIFKTVVVDSRMPWEDDMKRVFKNMEAQ